MQSCASPGVDECRCLLLVVLPFGGGRWGPARLSALCGAWGLAVRRRGTRAWSSSASD